MCGIGLIVCGIRIDISSLLLPEFTNPATETEQLLISADDIKAVLERRGPDSIGSKDIFLCAKGASSFEEIHIQSSIEGEESTQRGSGCCDCITSRNEESCRIGHGSLGTRLFGRLHFIGATLQLRGINPIAQPLVDTSGNILVYNGEIFGGIDVNRESNDTEVLMESLGNCCICSSQYQSAFCCSGNVKTSVPELLSTIKGPWALIYWQECSKTIWFGRDAFGRRSLLVHWPSSKDSRLLLSSVAPSSSIGENFEDESELNFWEELSCGVYSISTSALMDGSLGGELKRHQWSDPVLKELIEWNKTSVEPKPEELLVSRKRIPVEQRGIQLASPIKMLPNIGHMQTAVLLPSQAVLVALRESVRRRTTFTTVHQTGKCDSTKLPGSPVAVLFSGGLDSMILAALLDECLDPKYEIDLLNVSFDGESAPDRISARAGVTELRRITTSRRWKLVGIDADLSKLTSETKHVMSLINPAKTYMDLNIGTALWLAAGGDGWINEEISENNRANYLRVKYKSESRILLVGAGADEQCAGYGRHRTKYREGSWTRLHEEMKIDMQRIWKRNLGRDDRCMADSGKEARFPFLDEDVIRTLLAIPLWEIADLDQPSGIGDKKILREIPAPFVASSICQGSCLCCRLNQRVKAFTRLQHNLISPDTAEIVAHLLGLYEAAVLPKRAIQFGSRIARESNRKNFGSNRAANQASAGSVVISMASNSC